MEKIKKLINMKEKELKVSDLLNELDKFTNEEIFAFADESVLPRKVEKDSVVRSIVEKIYGEYTISRMLIVKAYMVNILAERLRKIN